MITEPQLEELLDDPGWAGNNEDIARNAAAIGYQNAKADVITDHAEQQKQAFLDAVMISLAPQFVTISPIADAQTGDIPIAIYSAHARIAANALWNAREADRLARMEGRDPK